MAFSKCTTLHCTQVPPFSQTVIFSRSAIGAPSGIEKRIVTEAALSTSVVHPNVVATFHYDIKQVRQREPHDNNNSSLWNSVSTLEPSADASAAASAPLRIEDATGADWKLFLVQVQ